MQSNNVDIQKSPPEKRKRGRPLTRVFMDLFEYAATAFNPQKYASLPLEKALEKYARYIKKAASDYLPYARGLELEDLISVGNIAVIRAVKMYDPIKIRWKGRKRRKLCSFDTYVRENIRWAIKNEIDKVAPKYVSLDSLDAPMGSEDDTPFHELIADENSVSPFQSALLAEMWGIVERLPAAQQSVLKMRYKEGKTLEQAGEVLGLTRERIRQIECEAKRTLRRLMCGEN